MNAPINRVLSEDKSKKNQGSGKAALLNSLDQKTENCSLFILTEINLLQIPPKSIPDLIQI
jgi:hypothetical protein